MGFSFILKRTNKGHPSTIKATNLEMFLTNISAFHSAQPTILKIKTNADNALMDFHLTKSSQYWARYF